MAKAQKPQSEGEPSGNRGRPRIDIDLDLLGNLAAQGCSIDEICSMLRRSGLKIDKRTLKRRLTEDKYRDAFDDGINYAKFALRSQMLKQSRLLNSAGVHMSIFLAKNWLGMTDKQALTDKDGNELVIKIEGGLPNTPPPAPTELPEEPQQSQ